MAEPELSAEAAMKLLPTRLVMNVLALCEYTRQQERDGFILLVSKEGDGKSTLANEIGFLTNMFQDRFALANNVYSPESFKHAVYSEKAKTIIADEGTSLFLRADSLSDWGRERVRILSQMRSRQHIVIVTLTESGLARVEPQLLHDRVTALIRITKRGRMRWYSKEKLAKLEVDKDRRMIKRWPPENWAGSFKPMPSGVYAEYNKHKDSSLEKEAIGEDMTGWLKQSEAARVMGVSQPTIARMIEREELHAVQNGIGVYRVDPNDVRRIMNERQASRG